MGKEVIFVVEESPEGGYQAKALGFSIGRPLRLLRQAGVRGPLHVRLGTTDVALRPAEAAGIAIRLAGPERA